MPEVPPSVRNLPTSAKLVYVILETHGTALTQTDIRSLTGLSPDTTRRALETLREDALVTKRPFPDDRRKRLYTLTEQANQVVAGGSA